MPRPPKNKAIEPAKSSAGPARHIDVDNFIRVRDSVYTRLTTIQNLIQSFSVDYLRQTNLLLGEGTNLEHVPDFEDALGGLMPAPPLPVAPAVEEKKERKKRTHDPNAPRRPLTPYFLYMQTARPIIASDLGETAPRGAVQEEGQRRWGVMDADEKLGWHQAYQYNLRLYNARVHSYKSGNLAARDMTDDDARKYADDNNIHASASSGAVDGGDRLGNDQDAIAQQLQQVSKAEAADDSTAKTPKKGKTPAKRKTATPATEAAAASAAPAAATPASPAQKRKRASKAADASEEPKAKSGGRKKAKA